MALDYGGRMSHFCSPVKFVWFKLKACVKGIDCTSKSVENKDLEDLILTKEYRVNHCMEVTNKFITAALIAKKKTPNQIFLHKFVKTTY